MAKLDGYLRSIEKFGAAGAVLASGQAVTLRFPTGDRHATQVTPHDQLVGLVREVAPPGVLDQIDKNRPGRFEHESNGIRYAVSIAPRPGAWQVAIAAITEPAEPVRAAVAPPAAAVAAQAPAAPDQAIERGQYDSSAVQRIPASGSVLLDDLTRTARAAHATDVYLATAAQPMQRANGELTLIGSAALDGDSLSRELGIVAPADARATWLEHGGAVFAYGDGGGRVRATLTRDHRGPSAALRLLPDEAPGLDRLNLSIEDWLQGEGLVVIAGPSGSGKTVALAAIVRALADRRRRTISIEDPIEIVHVSPWISQREVGPHVASVAAGVASAMLEGADAIAVGSVSSGDAASAVVDAVAGGHFVVMTIVAPVAGVAPLERVIDLLPVDRRELARGICATALLGTICPVVTRSGRTFEITRASRSI
jgi:twitching motility protein PilT